jgi:hypothetical protein
MEQANLQDDVTQAIGETAVRRVKLFSHFLNYFCVWGGLIGLTLCVATRSVPIAGLGAVATSIGLYLLAEGYLLRQDHMFFASPGNTKRRVFNRYFSKQASMALSLRFTEPGGRRPATDLEVRTARTAFAKTQDAELEHRFRKFKWRYFVRDVVDAMKA